MDLLEDQAPGAGGEVQLTDAMARSLEREAMYAVVVDPAQRLRHRHALRLDRDERPHGRLRPALLRRLLGRLWTPAAGSSASRKTIRFRNDNSSTWVLELSFLGGVWG